MTFYLIAIISISFFFFKKDFHKERRNIFVGKLLDSFI